MHVHLSESLFEVALAAEDLLSAGSVLVCMAPGVPPGMSSIKSFVGEETDLEHNAHPHWKPMESE